VSKPPANACAGPFGTFYDFYIERPWLVGLLGRAVWGMDGSVLYESMDPIGEAAPGSTIADVPCGGGVAFRALRPDQDLRYLAGDLDPKMLQRAERRARARSLGQVECVTAGMTELPFGDAEVDLFLSYSGLHMLDEPQQAIEEIARCLKPGGRVIGTAFFSGGSRRARRIFEAGGRRGHALPPDRGELMDWLAGAGLAEPTIGPQPTFAAFSARKPLAPQGGQIVTARGAKIT
jgi:ubiquinone/menaquinone biosynthesis C-methylase UbiE